VIGSVLTGFDFGPIRPLYPEILVLLSGVGKHEPDGFGKSLNREIGQLVGRHLGSSETRHTLLFGWIITTAIITILAQEERRYSF
jgi:hypothetical protein